MFPFDLDPDASRGFFLHPRMTHSQRVPLSAQPFPAVHPQTVSLLFSPVGLGPGGDCSRRFSPDALIHCVCLHKGSPSCCVGTGRVSGRPGLPVTHTRTQGGHRLGDRGREPLVLSVLCVCVWEGVRGAGGGAGDLEGSGGS